MEFQNYTMIYLLQNKIQNYAWGDSSSIAALTGISNQDQKPQAELWMGAHPGAPSFVKHESGNISLVDLIQTDPEYFLGKVVFEKFKQLPFLFKILAAQQPLSIQAHPNLAQAQEGFRHENDLKVPLDALFRNYKDNNHKPEIICALTPFYAMNGFLPVDQITKNFSLVSDAVSTKLISILESSTEDKLKHFFSTLMHLEPADQERFLGKVVSAAQKEKGLAFEWIVKLNQYYPNDIGVLCPLFLNVVLLNPGEAMFLGAGQLHSYLQGVGVELMANSDNVLRGGLTPKHIDVNELLKVLHFKTEPLQILKPQGFLEEKFYEDFTEEFSLRTIEISSPNSFEYESNGAPSILFCYAGAGDFHTGEQRIPFRKGDSFFVPAGQKPFRISGISYFYKATITLGH